MQDETRTNDIAMIERLRSLEGPLRARGVTSMGMFGSRARGDHRDNSDLDVLVAVDEKVRFTLLDLADLAVMTSDCTGLAVNPVIAADLQPAFKQRILDDLTEIF